MTDAPGFPDEVARLKERARRIWSGELPRHELIDVELGADPAIAADVTSMVDDGGSHLRAALPHLVLDTQATADTVMAGRNAGWLGLAYELLHQGVLAHDDVIDGLDRRRRRSSVWAAAGIPLAVGLGDLAMWLGAVAVDRVDLPAEDRRRAAATFAATARAIHQGQVAELRARIGHELPDVDWCERTTDLKTGSLFAAVIDAGLACAGAPDEARRLASPVGRALGICFQMVDDLEDGLGQGFTDRYAPDLWEGKPSWLVAVAAAAVGPDERRLLAKHLYRPAGEKDESDVSTVTGVLERADAADRLHAMLRGRQRDLAAGAGRLGDGFVELMGVIGDWLDHQADSTMRAHTARAGDRVSPRPAGKPKLR